MKHSILGALAVGASIAAAQSNSTTNAFMQSCAAFANSTQIPNSTFITATYVPAGTNLTFPNADPSCTRTSQLVNTAMCRIQANITTSSTSGLSFEAWLPQNWTGRFLSTGNGGLGGCIQYEDLDFTTSLGFASVATNNGHDGMSGRFFFQNPEVVEDFVYRAVFTGITVGKNVTQTFYKKSLTKSYYLGCSTGGRQGMKMVQDFPDLFDGVVAGAPAMNFNNLNTWSAHFLPVTGSNTSDTFVPQSLWNVVHDDIVAQCDDRDGVKDGIIEAPDLCPYQANALLCSDTVVAPNCLTQKQVATVNTIFSDLKAPNGTVLYPRMQPGSEKTGAFNAYYNGQASDKSDWIKFVVMADPNFDLTKFTPDLWAKADTLDPFNVATFKGDISAFQKRGGKLLHYHGTMDPIISSENSPRYYELVRSTMKQEPAQLDDFYRFFRISGMGHCSGGPGAHYIGNQRKQLADPNEPENNLLMNMVRWVEEGQAPDVVAGVAFMNDTQGGQVSFTRNHCRWPLKNKFSGSGDPNDAASWKCVSYNNTTPQSSEIVNYVPSSSQGTQVFISGYPYFCSGSRYE
ncbi:tannase-domain-containing protein [Periconia macrospinosa]|uniref:Carboxylic ester hydrolase n=1 Tax=Periconia macrospinosa TaxID=97972 RepID=A0A2V1DAS6_9PLEO|nr:tannase-domain-containing protein [Periconia macrospinosa]